MTRSVPPFHHVTERRKKRRLSLAGPDALDNAVALDKSVEGVVALAHGADEAAEGVDVVLALDLAAVLINLGDGDLHRGVVLGLDDAVSGAALPQDILSLYPTLTFHG